MSDYFGLPADAVLFPNIIQDVDLVLRPVRGPGLNDWVVTADGYFEPGDGSQTYVDISVRVNGLQAEKESLDLIERCIRNDEEAAVELAQGLIGLGTLYGNVREGG